MPTIGEGGHLTNLSTIRKTQDLNIGNSKKHLNPRKNFNMCRQKEISFPCSAVARMYQYNQSMKQRYMCKMCPNQHLKAGMVNKMNPI